MQQNREKQMFMKKCLLVITGIVWFLCGIWWIFEPDMPILFYFGRPELRTYHLYMAQDFLVVWYVLFFFLLPVVGALCAIGVKVKDEAAKVWTDRMAAGTFSVIILLFLTSMLVFVKSILLLAIPAVLLLVYGVWMCVACKGAKKSAKLCVALVCLVLVWMGTIFAWQYKDIQQCVGKERYEDYMKNKERYYWNLFLTFPEDLCNADRFHPKFELIYTNMFNAYGEKFTLEELREAYINFESGEGSWYRLRQFEDARYSAADKYDDQALFEYREEVLERLEQGTKPREDYTLEELEALMQKTYEDLKEPVFEYYEHRFD